MFEKPNKIRPAILGGVLIGTISGLPGLNLINCCCCAGVMLGGMLAVYLYRQEFTSGMPPMESSDALILGIIAGIAGALVGTILGSVILLIFGPLEAKLLRQAWERLVVRLEQGGGMPPGSVEDLRAKMDQSMEEAKSIGGILRSLIFSLILYPIFSMLGGLIGYGFFGRKKSVPPALPPQA
jgi:hypothetical protein